MQLSRTSNDDDGRRDSLPAYCNDIAEPSHILDQQEDLLDLDWSVVTPDCTALSPQPPSGNLNSIEIPKAIAEETSLRGTESEVLVPKAPPTETLPTTTPDSGSTPYDASMTKTEDSTTTENPKPEPTEIRQSAASAPMLPNSNEVLSRPHSSSPRTYDPRTSPPALIRAVYRGDIEAVRALILAGNDIEVRHPTNNKTAAIVAALLGDSEVLEILLDSGASVAAKDYFSRTALHYAVSEDWIDCVKLLLARKAPIDCKDSQGDLPLHLAARYSQNPTLEVMVARHPDPLQHRDRLRRNILHLAAAYRSEEFIKIILDHIRTTKHRQDCSKSTTQQSETSSKCDCPVYPGIDAEDQKGQTALQLALSRRFPSIVSLLLQYLPSSAVDCPRRRYIWSSSDFTSSGPISWERALHYAIRHSHVGLFKALLDAGADVKLLNSQGITPLQLAIHSNNKDATTTLLAHGANPMEPCTIHGNLLLLEEAVQSFSPSILEDAVALRPGLDLCSSAAIRAVLKQTQIGTRWNTVKVLIKRCPVKDQVRKILDEEEIIFQALSSDDSSPKIIKFLLRKGANVELQSKYNSAPQDLSDWRMPLHEAAALEKTDVAAILLQYGASVLSKSSNGWLPLHYAIRYADLKTVRYFLERTQLQIGGEPKEGAAGSTEMTTAMKIACKRGSMDIVELILQRSNLDPTELDKEVLRIAVQFGRKDVTKYLLNFCSFTLATLNAVRKAKFEILQDEDERSGNSQEDYEACQVLIADAIDRDGSKAPNHKTKKKL